MPLSARSFRVRCTLTTLAALAANVALAHEPPTVTVDTRRFSGVFAASSADPAFSPRRGDEVAASRPIIQIAILLDTSGSMEGLINQARSRIWDVVNVMTKARKNGQRPEFQVALYQYGSDQLPSGEGFLTMIQPFTSDLDLLSERLFALRISGSEEYCGKVMDSALRQLSWDATSPSAPVVAQPLRMLIIAGNEAFTQGNVSYRGPAESAKSRGVLVNTIYCGDFYEGGATGWRDAAMLGSGAYNAIDQNQRVIEIFCPQDDRLLGLNNELNSTYIPFGSMGEQRALMQTSQDSVNIGLSKSGGMSRIAAKGSASYSNAHWDLVDAVNTKSVDLDRVETDDLPADMRPMTTAQRKEHIATILARRAAIQAQIRTLSAEREQCLREQRSRLEKPAGETLDSAIIKTMREQAQRLGFTFSPD